MLQSPCLFITLSPGIPEGSLILGEALWPLPMSIVTGFPAPFCVSPDFPPMSSSAVGRSLEALLIAFHVPH